MWPLTWALKEIDPVGIHRQTMNSIIMSRIAPKQNAFKFKSVPHKQEDGPPGQRGLACDPPSLKFVKNMPYNS